MTRAGLRRLIGIASIAVQALTVACDPGMLIRQTNYPDQAANRDSALEAQVVVSVKATSQLIGKTWYDPEVKVANGYYSPITVTDIELSARGKTYEKDSHIPDGLPLTIQPGNTGTVGVVFRLDAAVYEVFLRHPAELLAHYQTGAEEKTARAGIVGSR